MTEQAFGRPPTPDHKGFGSQRLFQIVSIKTIYLGGFFPGPDRMDIRPAPMNPVFTNFDRATMRCRERLRPRDHPPPQPGMPRCRQFQAADFRMTEVTRCRRSG